MNSLGMDNHLIQFFMYIFYNYLGLLEAVFSKFSVTELFFYAGNVHYHQESVLQFTLFADVQISCSVQNI